MTPADEPAWFDEDIVIAIHDRQVAEHGGTEGIRDQGMLESALARPQQLWASANADLYDLAAAYTFGLAKNHPFLDGNKRIIAVMCETFLALYDKEIHLSQAEKYVRYCCLAAGDETEESFASWLRENSGPLEN